MKSAYANDNARNYAVCVAAFIAMFALVWWWVEARG